MGNPRYLERFASYDDSLVYDFAKYEYEWESSQQFRANFLPVVGADYLHDTLGYAPAPVDNAKEIVRGVQVPSTWAEYDTMKSDAFVKCRRIGIGKLYTIDESNVRHWAWARIMRMPETNIVNDRARVLPLIFEFTRESDWKGVNAVQGTVALTLASQNFQITNPGDLPTEEIVFRLRSNSLTGFTNPILRNLTAGSVYEISSTRDAVSANSEIRIDGETYRVQWSDNDGATYADDYGLVTLPATQAGLFGLKPGINDLQYVNTGAPSASLEYYFFPKYAI